MKIKNHCGNLKAPRNIPSIHNISTCCSNSCIGRYILNDIKVFWFEYSICWCMQDFSYIYTFHKKMQTTVYVLDEISLFTFSVTFWNDEIFRFYEVLVFFCCSSFHLSNLFFPFGWTHTCIPPFKLLCIQWIAYWKWSP